MKDIKKEKIIARKFYDEWRNVNSFSPALNETVIVSLKGWNHIAGTKGHKRNVLDVLRRFKLLPYAKKLIETANTIQYKRKKKGITYIAIEAIMKINLKNQEIERKVRVVLIQDKKGHYIFYSVMDKQT